MADRLQKILAAAGLASRRAAEVWVREGRVAVDGVVITELGAQADPDTQRITVDGRPIPPISKRKIYIVLNKPRGFACTLADPHAAHLISELVDLPGKPMLRPVGRLDIESEGLIFMSDDGDFINKMTHPRYHIPKTYLATVRGVPEESGLERIRKGIMLEDGRTAPAERAELVGTFPATDTSDVELIIHEGRNRQVRRMFAAIGNNVLRLVRTKIGAITIRALPSGAWRHLTAAELTRLTEMPTDAASSVPGAARRSRPITAPSARPVGKRTPPAARADLGGKNLHKARRGAPRHIDPRDRPDYVWPERKERPPKAP